MVSTAAEVEAEQQEQRMSRRSYVSDEGSLLPRGQCKRKRLFEATYATSINGDQAAFADLNQNPGQSTVSPHFNAITRNVAIYSWRNKRLATTSETMLCMGLLGSREGPPVGDCNVYPPNAASYAEMSWRGRMSLVGNGQHFSSTGAFMMYCISNLVLVHDTITDLDHPLQFHGDTDIDTDGDGDNKKYIGKYIEVDHHSGCAQS
eukprot:UN3685